MNFGDKFSQAEVDDIFGEFEVDDDGFVESKAVIGLFVAGGGEEKKEEKKEEGEFKSKNTIQSVVLFCGDLDVSIMSRLGKVP